RRRAAGRGDLVDDLLGDAGRAAAAVHLDAEVVDHDARALGRRQEGDPASDAAPGPRDRDRLALEVTRHEPPPSVPRLTGDRRVSSSPASGPATWGGTTGARYPRRSKAATRRSVCSRSS